MIELEYHHFATANGVWIITDLYHHKKIQPDIMSIQMEEYNTTYEVAVCVVVMVGGSPEPDSKPLDPTTNLPIYKKYGKQENMFNTTTGTQSAKSSFRKLHKSRFRQTIQDVCFCKHVY